VYAVQAAFAPEVAGQRPALKIGSWTPSTHTLSTIQSRLIIIISVACCLLLRGLSYKNTFTALQRLSF